MVPMVKLYPGARIKLVDEWVAGCWENRDGLMDGWLGQTVTVSAVYQRWCTIEEDGENWGWFPAAIAEIVEAELPDMGDLI